MPPGFHALLPLQLTPANNCGHRNYLVPDQHLNPRFYTLAPLGVFFPEVTEPQNPRMILEGILNLISFQPPATMCEPISSSPVLDSFPLLSPPLPDPRGHRAPRIPAPLLCPLRCSLADLFTAPCEQICPKIWVSNLKATKYGPV